MHDNLFEGLRKLDLEDLVYPLFEIDTYRSKMGEDRDVCVLSFTVKERNPARDIMEFIEKGYDFVLDADVSSGENDSGEYFVFVELNRSPKLAEQIEEISYGLKKLTGIENWKFKYHKSKDKNDLAISSLNEAVPTTPEKYDALLKKVKTEEMKKFFTKTLMDDISVDGDILTIYKPYGQTYHFKVIKDGSSSNILEEINQPPNMDDRSMSEVLWLTKVMGDYNITKISDYYMFENGNRSILLQRIEI